MSGRKHRYETYVQPHLEDITIWVRTMTEQQIAARLGIAESTWHDYKNKHPELAEAVIRGRQDLISDVKSALIKRAKGFTYEEEKTYMKEGANGELTAYTEITKKQALPDVAACNSILQNLDEGWCRDKAQARLRERELELKRKIANANYWLEDEEES